jgi:X-X-X-Leu-X-X-Gly heptad repeat protein
MPLLTPLLVAVTYLFAPQAEGAAPTTGPQGTGAAKPNVDGNQAPAKEKTEIKDEPQADDANKNEKFLGAKVTKRSLAGVAALANRSALIFIYPDVLGKKKQRSDTQLRTQAFCPGIFAFLAVFRVVEKKNEVADVLHNLQVNQKLKEKVNDPDVSGYLWHKSVSDVTSKSVQGAYRRPQAASYRATCCYVASKVDPDKADAHRLNALYLTTLGFSLASDLVNQEGVEKNQNLDSALRFVSDLKALKEELDKDELNLPSLSNGVTSLSNGVTSLSNGVTTLTDEITKLKKQIKELQERPVSGSTGGGVAVVTVPQPVVQPQPQPAPAYYCYYCTYCPQVPHYHCPQGGVAASSVASPNTQGTEGCWLFWKR